MIETSLLIHVRCYVIHTPCLCGICAQQLPPWVNSLSGALKYVFAIFGFVRSTIDFLVFFLGKWGPPCENIDRDLHVAPVVGPF